MSYYISFVNRSFFVSWNANRYICEKHKYHPLFAAKLIICECLVMLVVCKLRKNHVRQNRDHSITIDYKSFDKCYYFQKLYVYNIYYTFFVNYNSKIATYTHTHSRYLNFYKPHEWPNTSNLIAFSTPLPPPACTVFRIKRERVSPTAVLNSEKNCFFF